MAQQAIVAYFSFFYLSLVGFQKFQTLIGQKVTGVPECYAIAMSRSVPSPVDRTGHTDQCWLLHKMVLVSLPSQDKVALGTTGQRVITQKALSWWIPSWM